MGDNLIGHGLLDYLFVLFMLSYAYWAGQTKPHRILYILPACLSCFFFIPFGSNLTADKLVPVMFIGSVVLSKGISYFSIKKKMNNSWIGKIWLMILTSIIVGIMYLIHYSNYIESPLINTRLIVQVIGYINIALIYIIVRKECSIEKGKKLLLKSFIITTSILCFYGIYQYIAHLYGLPFRGIVYSAGETGIGVFSDAESDVVFRINSFANEPKRLTYFLFVGLIILFKYREEIITKINVIYYVIIVMIHITVLWLTYSTSIYISIGIFAFCLMLYVIFVKYNKALFRQLLFFIFLGFVVFLYQKSYVERLYDARVSKQLEAEEIRTEVIGQKFILTYPEMLIIGVGPGVYNFALTKEYPETPLVGRGTWLLPFNSGLMTYLYDFGVIGFCLLLFPFAEILFNRKISVGNEFSIFVVFLFCTAITLNPAPTLFFFIGAFDGHKYVEE